jgi:hypothetical protein
MEFGKINPHHTHMKHSNSLVRVQLRAEPTFPAPQVYKHTQMSTKAYRFRLMMGMESVPETSYFLNILTRLVAREDFIKSCRRESFKSYKHEPVSLSLCPPQIPHILASDLRRICEERNRRATPYFVTRCICLYCSFVFLSNVILRF